MWWPPSCLGCIHSEKHPQNQISDGRCMGSSLLPSRENPTSQLYFPSLLGLLTTPVSSPWSIKTFLFSREGRSLRGRWESTGARGHLLCMAQLERCELEFQIQAALCRKTQAELSSAGQRSPPSPPRLHSPAIESRLYSEPGS